MITVNISNKDIFNSQTGTRLKDAAKEGKECVIDGIAIREVVSLNEETGEVNKKIINVIRTSENEFITGESKVITNRINELYDLFKEEVIGLNIKFIEIKSGKGTAASLIIL